MSIKIDNIDEKFIGVVLGSAKNINDMNSKYPDILPKCTCYSLILRVDLYKCIICVEELDRHTYSLFADLDMKPIGQDEILSENNVRILNRIGLVLSKYSKIYLELSRK